MRYWVFRFNEPEAGPFPEYDEAFRERQYLAGTWNVFGGWMGNADASSFTIRTDEYAPDGSPAPEHWPDI